MNKTSKESGAKYQQVAADIAANIVDGKFKVGDRIYARSLIAGNYAVSAETARRAVAVLNDLGIVETVKGSGVTIISYENALLYVKRYQDVRSVSEIRRTALNKIRLITDEYDSLKETINELVDRTNRFKAINPFTPHEAVIQENYLCIGHSLSDLNFWHNTFATVIAIRKGDNLIISPGPFEIIEKDSIIYFIGDDYCYDRVMDYLKSCLDIIGKK